MDILSKGLVYCGNHNQFVGTLVSIQRLRDLNVKYPIEFFTESDKRHFSQKKLRKLKIQLRFIDVNYKCKFSNKIHAIIHSSFEEILFIDSDVLFIKNPSFIFNDQEYLTFGNLFWRDLEENYSDGSFKTDSGVIAISRKMVKNKLTKCLEFTEANFNSETKGDKESFKYSLEKLNHVPKRPDLIGFIHESLFFGCSMLQYFNDEPFFIHSTLMKFDFDIQNSPLWSHIGYVDKLMDINHVYSSIYIRFFPSVQNYEKCSQELFSMNDYLVLTQ